MKNKRLISTGAAVISSSLVAAIAIWKCTPESILEIFKSYGILMGVITGAYKTAQTITDIKKNGNS